jgi:hypothetical protein
LATDKDSYSEKEATARFEAALKSLASPPIFDESEFRLADLRASAGSLLIPRQLPPSPVMILARWVEGPLDVAVQRPHDADAR